MTAEVHSRFVAYFDMLGIADLTVRRPEVAWAALSKLAMEKARIRGYGIIDRKSGEAINERILDITFSDSIIIMTRGDEDLDLSAILITSLELFVASLAASIPIRGAIAHGPFLFNLDHSLFSGPPLVRAYRLGEAAQWLGVVVEAVVATRYTAIADSLQCGGAPLTTQWDVPEKGGASPHAVLDWPRTHRQNFMVNPPISVESFYQAFVQLFGPLRELPEGIQFSTKIQRDLLTAGSSADFANDDCWLRRYRQLNPFQIYREEWASALRRQTVASHYEIFVAMPFQERFSYRSQEIFTKVIGKAVEQANKADRLPREFRAPQPVDSPAGAVVITEEIVRQILESHIFVGDLTFENSGVILETGVALGVKPNRQIVLITQDRYEDLHFDLRNNKIISYNPKGASRQLSDALVTAAEHFEKQVQHYLKDVKRRLSPEAIAALRFYGEIQQSNRHFSIHAQNRGPNFPGADGLLRFSLAAAELRSNDLLWTEYLPGTTRGDIYGMHATEFGWAVIQSLWPELERPEPFERKS